MRFVYNASVEQITPPAASGADGAAAGSASPGTWRVGLASGPTVTADRLVVSTGGYSFPAVGTDGTGLRLLTGLGHKLSDGGCYASLTPLKGPHPGGEQLAGVMFGLFVFVCLFAVSPVFKLTWQLDGSLCLHHHGAPNMHLA